MAYTNAKFASDIYGPMISDFFNMEFWYWDTIFMTPGTLNNQPITPEPVLVNPLNQECTQSKSLSAQFE